MDVFLPIAQVLINPVEILLLSAIVGVLSGLFGVGGGFLMTPFLIFMGVPPAYAVANEANNILATSVSGSTTHYLKNTLDWLSLAYDENRYSALFKEKKVAVVTTVKGAGGNAQKAFEILSMQLSNYDLQVFEKFHLITKSEHQNEKSILNNRDVIESLNSYAEEFLDL